MFALWTRRGGINLRVRKRKVQKWFRYLTFCLLCPQGNKSYGGCDMRQHVPIKAAAEKIIHGSFFFIKCAENTFKKYVCAWRRNDAVGGNSGRVICEGPDFYFWHMKRVKSFEKRIEITLPLAAAGDRQILEAHKIFRKLRKQFFQLESRTLFYQRDLWDTEDKWLGWTCGFFGLKNWKLSLEVLEKIGEQKSC